MSEGDWRTGVFWWAILCAVLVAVAFQGSRGLYDSTEGRYAECAREMLVSGDFLRPTLDFAPHWTKPPLTYWAIAAGVRVFGRNAWGARAYLVPTFVFTALGVFWLARWLWDRPTGAIAALLYATMWGPAGAAFTVNSDSLLTLWETSALASFWWGVRSRRKFAFILMWLFFGLAFLTKGPPALLPVAVVVVFRILGRKTIPETIKPFVPAGIGLGLVVGMWWYVWAVARYPGLLSYWVKHEIVGRVATEEFSRHPHWYEAFTVYWPFLLGGSLPWLAVVFWLERRTFKEWLQGVRSRGFQSAVDRFQSTFRNMSPETSFLTLAFFVPLVVFSISRSKLPLYVLPLFPVGCCTLSRTISNFAARGILSRKGLLTLALASSAVIVSGKGVLADWPSKRDMGKVAWALQSAWPEKEGSDRPPLYIFSKSPCWGLQFYWGDPVIRVYPEPGAIPPPGYLPSSALTTDKGNFETPAGVPRRMVLTRKENASLLENILRQEGHNGMSRELTRHWVLVEMTVGSSSSASSQVGAGKITPGFTAKN